MRTLRWIITTFIAIAAMGFAARATANNTVVTTRTAAASAAAKATPAKLAAMVTQAKAAAPAAQAKPAKCTHGSQPPAVGTTSALNAGAVVTPCNVWAVGATKADSTAQSQTLIEHWNGKHWTSSTLVNPAGTTNGTYLAAVAGSSRKDVWVAGAYCHSENQCVQAFYHWNGAKWRPVPSPAPPAGVDGFIFGLSAPSAKSAWAVGELDSSTVERGLIEHWNGTKWRKVNAGLPTGKSIELNAVTASGANVLAVGDQAQSSGFQATLIVSWNGKHWTQSRIRNPFGKSANYSFAGASGGTCATSWFVGRTFSSPAADQPIAVHC